MNILSFVLFVCIVGCLYEVYRKGISLRVERAHRQRVSRVAYEAITQLRDVIHGLGWSSTLSSEFSKYDAQIRAADAIGKATFNMVARDPGFLNGENMFSHDKSAAVLATLELDELNGQRDELLKNPNLLAAMALMGRLMHKVLDGVNQNLHADHRH